jgi:hypothetical protein
MAIAEVSKNIKIYVTHVDAHTSKTDPTHNHNDKADKLAAVMTSKLTIFNKAPQKVTNTSTRKVTLQCYPNWQVCTPITKTKLVNINTHGLSRTGKILKLYYITSPYGILLNLH